MVMVCMVLNWFMLGKLDQYIYMLDRKKWNYKSQFVIFKVEGIQNILIIYFI